MKKRRPKLQAFRELHWAAKYMAIIRWLIYEGVYEDKFGYFGVKKEACDDVEK